MKISPSKVSRGTSFNWETHRGESCVSLLELFGWWTQKVSHRGFHFGWAKLRPEPMSFRMQFLISGWKSKVCSADGVGPPPSRRACRLQLEMSKNGSLKNSSCQKTLRNKSPRILRTHIVC